MPNESPSLFFDYVDPFAYVLDRAVAELEAEHGVSVRRVPLEINPPPTDLLDADDPAWHARWAAARARRTELPERPPSLVPWTRKAHELACHARERDRFGAVHRALFEATLIAALDVGRIDVLVEVAEASGLDRTRARVALDVDRYAATVAGMRAEAERRNVRRVPTLLVGSRRLEGVPDGAALTDLLVGR